jgi:hypothetical protein
MSSRLLRWIVLGFTCLWFGMLVPIHQRGQIQLPGRGASASVAPSGHCNRADAPCHRKVAAGDKQHPQKPGTPGDRENCAVCQFILGLHAPPPVTWYVERLGLVEVLAAAHYDAVAHCNVVLPIQGRAPPVV